MSGTVRKPVPPLELMDGNDLLDSMLESNLSETTKREFIEWAYTMNWLDDDQYKLAISRIEHLKKQS